MKRPFLFPIKYKFLGVLTSILLASLSLFFFFAYQTFSEDKKLFVMDLNLTLLKAITAEIKTELRGRLEELQVIAPRVYSAPSGAPESVFAGVSAQTKEELFSLSFYRATEPKKYTLVRQWTNEALLGKLSAPVNLLQMVDKKHPAPLDTFDPSGGVTILNRSVELEGGKSISIVSFIVSGTFLGDESKEMLIVVDYTQDFLRKLIAQSEIAEVFLIFKDGSLLAHPSESLTAAHAGAAFAHPIVARFKEGRFGRESTELMVGSEAYLCNVSETGFKDLLAVSQTRKSEAFLALQVLLEKSFLIATMILALSLLISLFFAGRLTNNIHKLREAAEQIGSGNFDLKIEVSSRDEVREVAASFQWMADRITALIAETTEKARLADELETARLVQSTLLTPPRLPTNNVDLVAHYAPATECGGDYWDASLNGNKLTVFIGDATGHGAPAAIVTAVAKSCFATLSQLNAEHPLPPDELLGFLNRIIYQSCQGKLLMTMSILQLDTETGELLIGNAGHESPFHLRGGAVNPEQAKADKESKAEVDVLFARGERLGFNPKERYRCEKAMLTPGDVMLLYTDGILEAKDGEGKQLGERALKKVLAADGARPLAVIRKDLVSALEAHVGDNPPEDDVTFVLGGWKKSAQAAKGKKVELAPTPEPVVAEISENGLKSFDETGAFEMPPVDLGGRKPSLQLDTVPEGAPQAPHSDDRAREEAEWRDMYLFGGRDWPEPGAKRSKKAA